MICVPWDDGIDPDKCAQPSAPGCDTGPEGGGGGGGDPAPPSGKQKAKLTRQLYEDCAKKAFGGTTGSIAGTNRTIPSYEAAGLTLDAALFEGVDPAVVGASMSLESNSSLDMTTNLNSNGTLDYGPMQINSAYVGTAFPNYPGATGTNLQPGDPFNGDAYANIASGASYLRTLGKRPQMYVGRHGAKGRRNALKKLVPSFPKVFDCIEKGLGLIKDKK